jgi:ribonucleotide monophosphatase NagD (HAD superfamily)
MIGDDLESDVGGAQAAGLKGFLVLSGKTSQRPDAQNQIQPDSVLSSVADFIPGE